MIKVKKTKLNGAKKTPIEVTRLEDPHTGGIARLDADGKPVLTARGRENGWEIVGFAAAKKGK